MPGGDGHLRLARSLYPEGVEPGENRPRRRVGGESPILLQPAGEPLGCLGELVEPVGLVWLDNQRLVVCDTGNRRLQVLDLARAGDMAAVLDCGAAPVTSVTAAESTR